WTRTGLDLKTRSLSTVAALTALGRASALELNIRMALGNGATKEEVLEIMLHMAPYAGFPAVWDAMKIAARVFEVCPAVPNVSCPLAVVRCLINLAKRPTNPIQSEAMRAVLMEAAIIRQS